MPTGLLPNAAPAGHDATTDPQAVVEACLAALAAGDLDLAMDRLAHDVRYVNVGLPAVQGRARVAKVFRGFDRPAVGFEAYLHAISADGPVVLTERTDVIVVGRLRAQFWVCGRFDVHDGRITLWRDSFDYVDVLRAVVRALAGIVVPTLRPRAPSGAGDAPGR